METKNEDDWKRSAAILAVILGITFLGISLFNSGSGNEITGSSVAVSEPMAYSWAIGLGALAIIITGAVALFKLNKQ
jgi:hypothetical protein